MQRVCFDAEPSAKDLEALGDRARWLVYRDLVRSRLAQVVRAALPRTKEALGEPGFSKEVTDWLSAGGSKTKYFRDVPSEFFSFAVERWTHAEPRWCADLARYEMLHWEVRSAPPHRSTADEFSFERMPVIDSAARVLRLGHPVHETPTPDSGYGAAPTILCVYRARNHDSAVWELNALAADLFENWIAGGSSVTESVHRVAATHGVEIGPVFVDKLAVVIADAIDLGIIVGGVDCVQ